jgi:hypothetical protein
MVTGLFVLRSVEVNQSCQLDSGKLDQKIMLKLSKPYNNVTVYKKRGNDFRVKLTILNGAVKGVVPQYSETEQQRKSR